MHKYKVITTIILTAIVIAGTASADIYINNKIGSDQNTGLSPENAVKTFSAAIKILSKTGERKLVLTNSDTPYFESLRLMNINGTPAQPIIVEGNGAILSGLRKLPVTKWQQKADGIWYYPHKRYGALRPYLVIDGRRVSEKPLDKLTELSHNWTKQGVFFKPEEGKSIKDYQLYGTVLTSGFTVNNSSYITCRNLTCEYFSNDGFNVHGDSQNLFFENIVGRKNGDDGFSIHEDVGVVVRGGSFYENNYGIQDVNASRSEYYGVIVRNNRRIGVNLLGGVHTLVDVVVEHNNGTQIQLESDFPKHLNFADSSPHFPGLFFLKNVWVANGKTGIKVLKQASVTISHSIIDDCTTGLMFNSTGTLHIYKSAIQNCTESNLDMTGTNFHMNLNRYTSGQMLMNGKIYRTEDFKNWQLDTKGDVYSLIATTSLSVDSIPNPQTYLQGDSNNKTPIMIGPTRSKNTVMNNVTQSLPKN